MVRGALALPAECLTAAAMAGCGKPASRADTMGTHYAPAVRAAT